MQKVSQRVVLVGGGHTHAIALRLFAMRPLPQTELMLVADGSRSAYSGMLPGFVEGRYTEDDLFIDLRRLAQASGARFIKAEAVGLDLQTRQLRLADRPPLAFDLLSLNIGSTPLFHDVPGAAVWAVPVKPVCSFVAHWQKLAARVAAGALGEQIVITGGGAGGVELALAMHAHLHGRAKITLVQGAKSLLASQAKGAGVTLAKRLRERGIELRLGERINHVADGIARTSAGQSLAFSALYWATDAGAPAWFKEAGLWVDERGFARVSSTLACLGQRGIFASGDCAAPQPRGLPKAGVFAVRQGRPLAENLRRAVSGEPLRQARWQTSYLALIGTADGSAVATRGRWSASGRWLMRLKEHIDRRFVARFKTLAVPRPGMATASSAAATAAAELMRCLGCGAKVSGSVLSEALRRIETDFLDVIQSGDSLLWGLQEREDTSLLVLPQDTRLLQSIDYFPSLVEDPFLAGRLACIHAFSDVVAKGALPHSAHVLAVMGLASAHLTADNLYQTLAGVATQLRLFKARLLGGHTAEGEQPAIGLMVNGIASGTLLRKNGGSPGDALILTKPLGTGLIFAAAMQGRCPAAWLDAALDSMLQSHADLVELLQSSAVHGATDVTGFGLLGHLGEMLRDKPLRAQVQMSQVPTLPGSRSLAETGVFSSLFAENSRILDRVEWLQGEGQLEALWCDPQTCGGLLLSVAPGCAQEVIATLHAHGYRQAALIGHLLARSDRADGMDVTLS